MHESIPHTHTHTQIVGEQQITQGKSKIIMHDLTHNYMHTQSDVHT